MMYIDMITLSITVRVRSPDIAWEHETCTMQICSFVALYFAAASLAGLGGLFKLQKEFLSVFPEIQLSMILRPHNDNNHVPKLYGWLRNAVVFPV